MAFLTKTHLSRRTFLHGVGVTMALPLLESMIPAGTAFGQTVARPRTRLGAIYFPHGAIMPPVAVPTPTTCTGIFIAFAFAKALATVPLQA